MQSEPREWDGDLLSLLADLDDLYTQLSARSREMRTALIDRDGPAVTAGNRDVRRLTTRLRGCERELTDQLRACGLMGADERLTLPRLALQPRVQANVAVLAEDGVHIVGPGTGYLAEAEEGPGRMAEPAEILAAIEPGFPETGQIDVDSFPGSLDSKQSRPDAIQAERQEMRPEDAEREWDHLRPRSCEPSDPHDGGSSPHEY